MNKRDLELAKLAAAKRIAARNSPKAKKQKPPIKPRKSKHAGDPHKRAMIAFYASNRLASKRRQTPPWADMDAIAALYQIAAQMTERTGIQHHVDHVYPLRGVVVSGLHVHTNMRVVTASDNLKKRNLMPNEPDAALEDAETVRKAWRLMCREFKRKAAEILKEINGLSNV